MMPPCLIHPHATSLGPSHGDEVQREQDGTEEMVQPCMIYLHAHLFGFHHSDSTEEMMQPCLIYLLVHPISLGSITQTALKR